MTIPPKHFYMIRHGETEANAAQVMAGHTDSPLTQNGREQAAHAQKVVESLAVKPAAIFHSHLSRARDTANIINLNLKLPLFEDPDLAEIHVGELEGAPWEQCTHLLHGWGDTEKGESADDFFKRVKRGKIKALSRFNDPVLIVCHGGVMRAFGEIHGIPTPGKFKNAHLYEYTPIETQTGFPWNVSHYDICLRTGSLVREKADIYEQDAIAS